MGREIALQTGAAISEIVPLEPYTAADLDYTDPHSRTSREQADPSSRPGMASDTGDFAAFDTLFLGYPIWHGLAPRIIETFLEAHDFDGKRVHLFSTSSSSSGERSKEELERTHPDIGFDGLLHLTSRDLPEREELVGEWLLSLAEQEDSEVKVNVNVEGRTGELVLEESPSSGALIELLKEGRLEIEVDDYGNMEKVGELPIVLPRNDSPIEVGPGDVVLYLGNSLCFYYGTHSWDFTRLGHLEGISTREEALSFLGGAGPKEISIQLI